jgi:hypothetical protein
MAGSGRRRTLEAFSRHDIAGPVATATYAIGVAMREESRQDGLERAMFVDAETGALIREEPVVGASDDVSLEPLQRRYQPERRYIGVHTHPHSQPLSRQDVEVLLDQAPLCAVAAVARDGSWYLVSVAPDSPAPAADALRATLDGALLALGGNYQVPPYPDPAAARRALYHAAWEQVALALGLRYDRVEGRHLRAQVDPAARHRRNPRRHI